MQWAGKRKRLIENLPEGNEFGSRIPADPFRQVPVRRLKDDRRQDGVFSAEMNRQGCPQPKAIDNDGGWRDGARGDEIGERGFRVGLHGGLRGVNSA